MKHHYPNMAELLAFTISAKHLNFSHAARELGHTPSAISRQIANLESFFGANLFIRNGRQLTLTRSGALYLARVSEPLRNIGNASVELLAARGEGELLTIASVPTFTSKWLAPRLPAFLACAPGVTLSFARHLAHGDPFGQDLDAAIRYGNGKWEGVTSEYIDGRRFIVVCAPDFRDRFRLRHVGDVAAAPRLIHSQAETAWGKWARQYDLHQMRAMTGPRFEQYATLIQAAQAGLGLALIPAFLIRDNLAGGSLIEPFDVGIDVDDGHYLCYPPDRLSWRPGLRRFRDWLIAEARTTSAA
ncbi:LysR substrate-binding domain-containing protein [Robbsia andropogonis]|uniref:LysR substrate-binding domain-containing protein n=1 Tax=Robbsia andropogonis TaxID=28092 RepID=UPI002A6AA0E7|nr:LysR substrate-binding domain-containing protein [Robbsia andropogonis]